MVIYQSRTPAGATAFDVLAGQPDRVLVAVDFDGTLSPIVPDPEQAFADPGAVSALGRLGALVGQVAIITGRPARTCVRLGGFERVPGLERLIVLGQYGVERWDAASGEFRIPPAPAAIGAVAAALPELLADCGHPGARIEDKGRALGVHTRELPDPAAAFAVLQRPVTELASRHQLMVEPGRFVLEIRAAATDKGEALSGLVAEVGARVVVYAGDDLGDVAAFEALDGLRSRGLKCVGLYAASEEERTLAGLADVVCEQTAGVAAWLNAAADVIEGVGP